MDALEQRENVMSMTLQEMIVRFRPAIGTMAAVLLGFTVAGCTIPVEVRQTEAEQAPPPQQPPQDTPPPQPTQPEDADQLVLEATYPGPFEGTIIQRVRDPATDVICYFYVPEQVPHNREGDQIQYGNATIGSIDCVPAR